MRIPLWNSTEFLLTPLESSSKLKIKSRKRNVSRNTTLWSEYIVYGSHTFFSMFFSQPSRSCKSSSSWPLYEETTMKAGPFPNMNFSCILPGLRIPLLWNADPDPAFHLIGIRIWLLLFIKVMRICDPFERQRPSVAPFKPLKLLNLEILKCMQIRIQVFTLMRIQIQLFTWLGSDFCSSSQWCELATTWSVNGSPWLHVGPLKLLNFEFNANPDPASQQQIRWPNLGDRRETVDLGLRLRRWTTTCQSTTAIPSRPCFHSLPRYRYLLLYLRLLYLIR